MTTLKPNPEYALCEQEMSWFSNPAAKTVYTSRSKLGDEPLTERPEAERPKTLRWRQKDHAAVMLAWQEHRYEDMEKLCVPSHIPA